MIVERTVIMFLGPLLYHQYADFKLPFAGGCNLGKRTEPHFEWFEAFWHECYGRN